jgi:hypothetical protein
MVRYMDDIVWWSGSIDEAHETLRAAERFLAEERMLTIKAPVAIGHSAAGVMFCGMRASGETKWSPACW